MGKILMTIIEMIHIKINHACVGTIKIEYTEQLAKTKLPRNRAAILSYGAGLTRAPLT